MPDLFTNLDLLSVGITVAGIAVLGFTIYFSNRKSITNRSFLLFALISVFWGVANYINYKFNSENLVLWSLRLVIFFATWHAFSLLQLLFVFPKEHVDFPKKYKYILLPLVVLTSIVTLTPLAFSRIANLGIPGEVSTVSKGPGMLLFLLVTIINLVTAFYILFKKTKKAQGPEKKQLTTIFIGLLITFFLLVIFNFLLPGLFDYVTLMPFGALFILPFIIFTFYAIYKHHLFNIKDVATVFVALALTVVTFVEIIFADSLSLIIFRSSVFVLVLIFSIQLIRNIFNLEVANERLKELDQMKSEFVSLATHQIRAPLTAIKGYVSLIQEGDYGQYPNELNKPLQIVMDSTNNLVTIVADFLDVSRIEQGRMKYDYVDFDVKELVEETINQYRPNIEKRGLTLGLSVEPDRHYSINADRGKIKQAFGNILDNSIKYTPKGRIDVSVSQPDDKILIKISDTGVGIPKSTLPKLFQKFTRAENANETNILGTGLGLYVVKNMVEVMGGRVWAESQGEGTGSQFYIELPLKPIKV